MIHEAPRRQTCDTEIFQQTATLRGGLSYNEGKAEVISVATATTENRAVPTVSVSRQPRTA